MTTIVQYELYKLNTKIKLDLDICNDTQITLFVPVNLDSSTESLYESLNNSGYNLFNPNDPFYNDICTPYTSENDTDIIIDDRQKIIYKNNGRISITEKKSIYY